MTDVTLIDWMPFDSPSETRPFGLMLKPPFQRLPDDVRAKLFKIATDAIGPRPKLDDTGRPQGMWVASGTGAEWGFDSEGSRALFIMATKGDVLSHG